MTTPEVLTELPEDVRRRLLPHIEAAIADAVPEHRDRLVRAYFGEPPTMTARAHIVGARVYVYVHAELDDGTSDSMEIPGELVGLVVDRDRDIAVMW